MLSPIRAYFDEALKGNSSWWTWLAGFWAAVMVWFFASAILGIPMFGFMALADPDSMSEMMQKMMSETPETSGLEDALIASSFALPFIVVILFLLRNKLPAGARKVAMSIAGLLAFFLYAALSLALIPLQSATEEIMLRGYLNQGLGKYIRNPWIVFFITSAMFASLHLGNPEAAEGAASGKLFITMLSYFAFGMFACILTYIDGGLESAIGVHAANNLYASILLGYDNSALPTPTVFKTGLNANTDFIFTLLTLSLVCLILWKFKKPLIVDAPVTTANAFN